LLSSTKELFLENSEKIGYLLKLKWRAYNLLKNLFPVYCTPSQIRCSILRLRKGIPWIDLLPLHPSRAVMLTPPAYFPIITQILQHKYSEPANICQRRLDGNMTTDSKEGSLDCRKPHHPRKLIALPEYCKTNSESHCYVFWSTWSRPTQFKIAVVLTS
jgi:hypothetical protein